MAQLMSMIDATKIDPTQGIPSLPVGKHPVVIVDSEVKPVKAGDGGMVEFTLQIIDGPAKGNTGAYRLNLYNANPQAVEIAHRQMSALCHVVGVFQVNDTQQLHNRPFVIEVGLQKGEEAAAKGYTEVKRVFDINGNEPGKQGQAGQSAQPAAAGGAWGGQPAAGQQPPAGQQQPNAGATPGTWGGGNANTGGAQWSAPPGATVGAGQTPAPGQAAPGPSWGGQQAPAPGQQAGNGGGGQQPPWARS